MPQTVWSLLGMLLVVLLVLGAAYVVTRWLGTSYRGKDGARLPAAKVRGGSPRFQAIDQVSLGRAERLVLARLGDRVYLLGVTEQSFALLKELEGDEAREWLAAAETDAAPPSFLDALRENLRKRK